MISSSTSASADVFPLFLPFLDPPLLLVLPLFSRVGSSGSSSSPKRNPLPLSLRFSSDANAECAVLDANVDAVDVESSPSIHEKLEEASVGRAWGRRGARRGDDTGREDVFG